MLLKQQYVGVFIGLSIHVNRKKGKKERWNGRCIDSKEKKIGNRYIDTIDKRNNFGMTWMSLLAIRVL
jgi:hypothetical protein